MHSDQHIFEDMQMLVTDLQSSNSTNDKKAILETVRTNPELMLLLNYMYNPYHQYYVSWKNIQKRSDLNCPSPNTWAAQTDRHIWR